MGRILILFATILFALPGVAQTYLITGQVIDSQINASFPGATVLLKEDTTVITGCSTGQDGGFRLKRPSAKDYKIEVKYLGYRSKTVPLTGSVANPVPLRILLPGFCPYAYTRGKMPPCIGGHTDHLLLITYGLPSAKTMVKAKKGKLYLGGCEVTGCDPKYYCPIHKIKL